MSTDIDIYITSDEFLYDEWELVLSEFNAKEHVKNQTWSIKTSDGDVFLDLTQLIEGRHIKSDKYNWCIGLHVSGVGVKKYWLLYAIPYMTMSLIDGAVFYDPQSDIEIQDSENLVNYAMNRLVSTNSLEKLYKNGLLDSNEELVLDVQAIRKDN